MQGAMTQLLEGREKKLERQEVQLTALKDKNAELLQELECLRISSQDTVKTSLESQLGPVIREREALKEEMVKIKIDMDSSAKKISVYEAKLKKLREESVEIQVENSTLQSQSTSLLSQINTLQNSNVSLEAAKKRLEEAGVSWATERKELLADQSGLQKLHDNLQVSRFELNSNRRVVFYFASVSFVLRSLPCCLPKGPYFFWCHKVCHKVLTMSQYQEFLTVQKLCDTLCDTRYMDP